MLIKAGWNPPVPDDRVADRILRDIRMMQKKHNAIRNMRGFDRALNLSNRQKDVIVLAELGMTTREIADELGIGYETVKTYKTAICAKLGAKNMREAIKLTKERKDVA